MLHQVTLKLTNGKSICAYLEADSSLKAERKLMDFLDRDVYVSLGMLGPEDMVEEFTISEEGKVVSCVKLTPHKSIPMEDLEETPGLQVVG